ncbi:hypothetical protein O7621_10440 [Solwaraspora sp. WMMD937]|uniref:hypothetical protein n=1 Tax=Solwaraspora sp. WMMD937 TaxID=3016090 RepID=UPI00249C8FE6|nr:hypothetical protein [Solwaraspora sp. WMMD937]WFE23646.1 hypothetical protein O7621_10440 [Solwaraspora sp. WMMD937]
MPVAVDTSSVTGSTVGAWVARWIVGAALGQIVFGGTVRLVLAVLMGALLGGLGVWLLMRHRAARHPEQTRTRAEQAHPEQIRPKQTRAKQPPGPRIRYSPLAPPGRH